ncbi:MAG: YkgJ family cysteine cluster protein [Kiritimatiellae bacterium]|nr:YkgJ family cysteine cluster protein [Kiritimatiellia bacterium]
MDSTNFQCRQCGACCRWPGYVYLTGADIRRLSSHWKLSEEAFIEGYTRLAPNRGQLCLMVEADGACCFLLPDNRCACYEARPEQCRQYPSLWAPPEGCPGFAAPE